MNFFVCFDKGKKRPVSGNLGIAPPYLVNLAFLPLWVYVIVYDNHVTLLLGVFKRRFQSVGCHKDILGVFNDDSSQLVS